jgi:hypothetical protein
MNETLSRDTTNLYPDSSRRFQHGVGTSSLLSHSCHSEAERGGGICDSTVSREKDSSAAFDKRVPHPDLAFFAKLRWGFSTGVRS